MKQKSRRPGRSPSGVRTARQAQIVADVRQQILSGAWPPGTRLPARAALIEQYQTTPVTVQRAMTRLMDLSFTCVDGNRGTFVAAAPPCLANIGLVFPGPDMDQPYHASLFLSMVQDTRSGRLAPWRFTEYHALTSHVDEPDYQRLAHDLREGCLAGLIFATSPHELSRTPLWSQLRAAAGSVPQVAVMTTPSFPGLPAIAFGSEHYLATALDWLAARGCRRLAVLNVSHVPDAKMQWEAELPAAAASRGLSLPPERQQAVHSTIAPRARQLAHLLVSGPPDTRPDALLILDDTLVEAATLGVLDAGRTAPGDLAIVAHANFPYVPAAAVPVASLGWSTERVLDTCLAALAAQRCGQPVSVVQAIPVQFAAPEAAASHS